MDREDIIKMAKEAGASFETAESMFKFATLVAAAEREKVAVWMMKQGYATGHGDSTEDLLQELDWQIREQERELIARSMDKQVDLACDYLDRKWAQEMAAAIRARGER